MKILLCGHRSFAAQGLLELLEQAGHEVVCFSRGPTRRDGAMVSGTVEDLCANPHLQTPFDAVINYILLKNEPVTPNLAYMETLLKFCRQRDVRHLVHISSVSSYRSSLTRIDESAPIESSPKRKGVYGALKAATDEYLLSHLPEALKLSLVRPGFILARGQGNPLVGNALRLPWNRLLVIGNHKSEMPIISRELVNEAVARVVESPPSERSEVFLLVAVHSPTRREFAEAMCRRLGCGRAVTTFPKFFWFSLATACEWAETITGKPFPKGHSRVPRQRFDCRKTQQRLGIDLNCDWEEALQRSVEEQQPNFELPYAAGRALTPEPLTRARCVTFIGFGRIVRTKYLPALQRMKFGGEVCAYDVQARRDPTGHEVRVLKGARLESADLFVVATPGTAHIEALEHLSGVEGAVVVEKPLGYSMAELEQWNEFARDRRGPVLVCHNYRFKSNVQQMLSVLSRFNPGKLHHVEVHFESPAVADDSAVWMRDERRARTLLMDYGLHFMDVACMFGRGGWRVSQVRHQLDHRGHTGLIQGVVTGDYSVSFLLRQGFGPRRACVLFNFQNYSIGLGFFPDTCVVGMANDNPWLHLEEGIQSARVSIRKIWDKLTGGDSDLSHAQAISVAVNVDPACTPCLSVERLSNFYEMMFDLGDRVYGEGRAGSARPVAPAVIGRS